MRVVLITQNERFYLPSAISYFLDILPRDVEVVGVALLPQSPFGEKLDFASKVRKTLAVFGFYFTCRYAARYVWSLFRNKSVQSTITENKITVLDIDGTINSRKSLSRISKLNPDILISIQGNQIFKENLINLAPLGCINLHTALLPKYRGLMPTFWVIKNKEKRTGVSVFMVDEGIDSGPIIIQREIKIEGKSQEKLIRETKTLGMECLAEALMILKAGDFESLENNNDEKTYYGFPTREDVAEFRKSGGKFF